MDELIRILHEGCLSLVVGKGRSIHTFSGRGVSDLCKLLKNDPELLRGAMVADKAVGKAAAGLLICGQVEAVYADIISSPALAMLQQYGIQANYGQLVHHIKNRAGDDWCPMERACFDLASPEEIRKKVMPLIGLTSPGIQ